MNSSIVEKSLKNMGFDQLLPMQQEMLTLSREADRIILYSPTGSGKTLAYLLPLLEKIEKAPSGTTALIVVPSRELAIQISNVFRSFGSGLKSTTCYGGHPIRTEKNNLIEPPSLLIGTPGRICYHLQKGNIDSKNIALLVLDEFDKSLEAGFEKEMSFIWKSILSPDFVVFTSATMLQDFPEFVGPIRPVTIDYNSDTGPSRLTYKRSRSEDKDKLSLLLKVLGTISVGQTLVFCNHREAVERISELLQEYQVPHDTYHGGYLQSERERALIKFRNGTTTLLVTTDLASRGLDIPDVTNIIHYQQAQGETLFTHRNGRTARMSKDGTCWILLTKEEKLPDYLPVEIEDIQMSALQEFKVEKPQKSTLFVGAGKKDKIGKGDIAGWLIQKGGLTMEEIGTIDVLDFQSFVAVPANKIHQLVKILQQHKLKNKKIKVDRSN